MNHNYSRLEETNEDNTCIIDTSTIKGKILCGLSYIAGAIILVGVIVGLAFLFAIL